MIQISIAYRTDKNQHLRIVLCLPDKQHTPVFSYDMHSEDSEHWWGSLPTAVMQNKNILQFYFDVADDDGRLAREEWHTVPHLMPTACLNTDTQKPTILYCRWQDAPADAYLYTPLSLLTTVSDQEENSCAHTNTTASANTILSPLSDSLSTVTHIIVRTPHLHADERLYLCGEHPSLGAWNVEKALVMQQLDECRWAATIDASLLKGEGTEAKFIAKGLNGVRWEEGDNRHLQFITCTYNSNGLSSIAHCTPSLLELSDVCLSTIQPRLAGTLVPVFSLRSEGSFGVGDFGDLRRMVDFMAQTHQHVLQILPVNDTTTDGSWHDSYPYSAVSVFALHPMYVDIRQLPKLSLTRQQQQYFAQQQQLLNSLQQVDYERVNVVKHEYLHLAFSQHWHQVCCTRAFRTWFKGAEQWLVPYALWCTHRDHYATAQFDKWPQNTAWDERQRKKWRTIHQHQTHEHYYFYYVQWLLHTQLEAVHDHARSCGVILKGDIGIGVSPQACDVWQQPGLFHRNMQAGAPPDFFSHTGQNWGFPTYNWQTMAADGYRWWRQRLQHMARYFDAFRIDHILGFLRIWEIPLPHHDGAEGHFSPAIPLSEEQIKPYADLCIEDPYTPHTYHPRINAHNSQAYKALSNAQRDAFNDLYNNFYFHRHNHFWYLEALRKLPALLNATRMLPCGEDLGMVPDCLPGLMKQLNILSLELEIMPKGAQHGEFADAIRFPHLSVCMPSTHDVAPLKLWWQQDAARRQRYYNIMLRYEGSAPATLTPDMADDILRRYLHSPSMLCIIPIQDWLATINDLPQQQPEDERINDPANSKHYWRYRMNVTIEQLINNETTNHHLRQLIEESGR